MSTDCERIAEEEPVPDPAGQPRAGGAVRLYALAALTLVLIGLSLALAVPFLPAITWAAAFAILAWPMHRLLRRLLPWPAVAAAASTVLVLAIILGIGGFVAYQVAAEAGAAVKHLQKQSAEDGGLEATASKIPGVRRALDWSKRMGVHPDEEAKKLLGSVTGYVANLTQGSAAAAIQLLVAGFILYYLFLEPDAFVSEIRRLLPLSSAEGDFLIKRAGDSVHANLYATIVTGVLNSGSFGLLFWFFGLPAPLLWTVVMFVLSVLPIVGAGLIWAPAAVYLATQGRWLAAAGLVGWGLACFVAIGYFLYGRLVGERMRMHDVPALLSFLGGLALFGLSGMILGPAIVAVTMALLEVWHRRMADRGGRDPEAATKLVA